jgi:hypothetical protein
MHAVGMSMGMPTMKNCILAHLHGTSQSEMVAVLEECECLDKETKDAKKTGTEQPVNKQQSGQRTLQSNTMQSESETSMLLGGWRSTR